MKFDKIVDFLSDHKTDLLTIGSCLCTIASPFLAVRAKKKADKARSEALTKLNKEKLTIKEEIVCTGKYYIAPALCTAGAIGLNISSHSIDSKTAKESAALAAASSMAAELAQNTLATYSEKVIEQIGPEKEQQIRTEAHEAAVSNTVLASMDGSMVLQHWFVEPTMGQPIYCTRNDILSAISDVNHMINEAGYSCLSDFYESMRTADRSYATIADDLFWTREEGLLEIRESYVFPKDDVINVTLPDGYIVPAQRIHFINSHTFDDYRPKEADIYD